MKWQGSHGLRSETAGVLVAAWEGKSLPVRMRRALRRSEKDAALLAEVVELRA